MPRSCIRWTFTTSHEALVLDYAESLTRQDSITGQWYDCSAHMLWIGEADPPARWRPRGVHAGHQEPAGLQARAHRIAG